MYTVQNTRNHENMSFWLFSYISGLLDASVLLNVDKTLLVKYFFM